MKELKLKVCGMRDHRNILDVERIQPDLMGFIFYPASPRFVGEDFRIPNQLSSSVQRVGVFVNDTRQNIRRRIVENGLTAIQLHGNETPAECSQLKSENMKVIKVFHVDEKFDFAITEPYKSVVDFFLFDSKGKYYGGNASAFGWDILQKYDQEIPFFLSGGISLENTDQLDALRGMNLYAIDVNSGVEVSAGMKDVLKVSMIKDRIKNKTWI
jgi:phosphoribosylanthranilate isomerase